MPQDELPPWDDCKIAFAITGKIDAKGEALVWSYLNEFPYDLIEVDASCCQCFAIFRVEGIPCFQEGKKINSIIKKHNL